MKALYSVCHAVQVSLWRRRVGRRSPDVALRVRIKPDDAQKKTLFPHKGSFRFRTGRRPPVMTH